MSDPIIKRAARALAEADGVPSEADDLYHAMRVRTVLRAIREPSEAMVRAGAEPVFAGSGVKADAKALEVWQAMIDAAMGEG